MPSSPPTPLFLAHTRRQGSDSFNVHHVEEHLRGVAALAAEFANAFGSGDWAHLAGLWHDLGKYPPELRASGYDAEAHLESAPGRVDHSTLGAVYTRSGWG